MWPSFAKNPTSTSGPARAGFIGGSLNDQSWTVANPPPSKIYSPKPDISVRPVLYDTEEGASLENTDLEVETYELVSQSEGAATYRHVRPEPKGDTKRTVVKVYVEDHEQMNTVSFHIGVSTERYMTKELIEAVDNDVLSALVENTIDYMRKQLLDVLENGRFELERPVR
jgi:hypothetical protein